MIRRSNWKPEGRHKWKLASPFNLLCHGNQGTCQTHATFQICEKLE